MPVRRKVKSIDPALPQLVMAQGGRCFYCNEPFSKRRGPTRDHLFPRYMGCGLQGNKVAAHSKCNTSKGHRMPTEDEYERAIALYAGLGLQLKYQMKPVGTQTVYELVRTTEPTP